MKTKIWILFNSFLMLGLITMLATSCKKDESILKKDPFSDEGGLSNALFNPRLTYGTMTDQAGNTYKTITIGTQTWMAENLHTTKYRNGDEIPKVTDDLPWEDLTTGAYCNYLNKTNKDLIAAYGRLYNWYALSDSRNIAPTGWHVPTDEEWTVLTDYLGGEAIAGGKLKEAKFAHWYDHDRDTSATNEAGFTALPGGYRHDYGYFSYVGYVGYWWSSTEDSTYTAWSWNMYYDGSNVTRATRSRRNGFSVRCLRD